MWKPIDEAPKDKSVLGKSEDGVAQIEYDNGCWMQLILAYDGAFETLKPDAPFTHFILLEDLDK